MGADRVSEVGGTMASNVEPVGLDESQEALVVQVESLAWRLDLSYLTVLAMFTSKEGN